MSAPGPHEPLDLVNPSASAKGMRIDSLFHHLATQGEGTAQARAVKAEILRRQAETEERVAAASIRASEAAVETAEATARAATAAAAASNAAKRSATYLLIFVIAAIVIGIVNALATWLHR